MDNSKAETNLSRLQALYTLIQKLTPTSPEEQFNELLPFFADNCTISFKSMNNINSAATNPQAAVQNLKDVLASFTIAGRKITSWSSSTDGQLVTCQTEKRLLLLGEHVLDPFHETEVAAFDEGGAIKMLKMYCCWSPVASMIQDKTGVGPYKR